MWLGGLGGCTLSLWLDCGAGSGEKSEWTVIVAIPYKALQE